MSPRLRPPPHLHGRAGAALLTFALLAFGLLTMDLLREGPITQADIPISRWWREQMTAWVTQFMLVVSHLHSTAGICFMALAAGLALAWRRQWAWLPPLILSVPGGLLLNFAVKHAFQRARPSFDGPMVVFASHSFPSGHTAGATVWWGFVTVLYFAWEPRPSARAVAVALAGTMIGLAALSRVYLGAHYPSDVLAAIAEGLAWLVLCFMVLGVGKRYA